MIIVWILVGLFCWWFKRWCEDDPTTKKKIRGGRLMATQTFVCCGRTIRKGEDGALVEPFAKIDLRDNSWADKSSEIVGRCEISGDSLIEGSRIENYLIHNSRVRDCKIDSGSKYMRGFLTNREVEGLDIKSYLETK